MSLDWRPLSRREATRIVCAVGPESTGKTTLCRALAARFEVPWLAEYAREYLRDRPAYGALDVAAIAREQARREARLLAATAATGTVAGGVILDTDLTVIRVWWREKFGPPPGWLEDALVAQAPRLYLLCQPDLPWEPDPLRESPADLRRLYGEYRRLLIERQWPFVEIGGSGEARLLAAIAAARDVLAPDHSAPPAASSPPVP